MKIINILVLAGVVSISSCGPLMTDYSSLFEANEITPLNPQHITNKIIIINYLSNMGLSNAILVGQNAGHADDNNGFTLVEALKQSTGKYPALLGMDLGFHQLYESLNEKTSYITNYYSKGGLITLSMHPDNPYWETDVKDLRFNAFDLIISGDNEVYSNWMVVLDRAADFLQVLKDSDVIVLWRPFHEMNGGWFWWSGGWATQEEFRALWKQMYDYFTIDRQLDNLLWVYSPNFVNEDSMKATDYYYPGPSYADIVAMDYYQDTMNNINSYSSYDKLVALGKPLALAEIGPRPTVDGSFDDRKYLEIKQTYSFSYLLAWHSWVNNKIDILDNSYSSEFMNDTRVVTRDEVAW